MNPVSFPLPLPLPFFTCSSPLPVFFPVFSPPDLRRADFPEEGPLTGLQGFAYNPA